MNSIELKAKVDKATEAVNKKVETIIRHEKQAEKKLAVVIAGGWDINDRYQCQDTPQHHNCYWAVCDYQNKLDDIKNATQNLQEAERILEGWVGKYEKALKIENIICNEMPEIFAQLKTDLANEWTQYDISQREYMKEQKHKLAWSEFRKMYKYSIEYMLDRTDEQFLSVNLRTAESFIIDLYNRVKAVTGSVTDWSGISYRGKALNGYVAGEEGKAVVETILAGGYNIQKLHMRVLVKSLN